MRWRKLLVGLIVLAMIAIGAPALVTRAVSSAHLVSVETAPNDWPVVVFGAALNPETGEPMGFLAARLDLAVDLYRAGKTNRIIVSGATAPYYSEPRSMRKYLERAGVPGEIVTQDDHGYDSYDTCIRVRDVFKAHQVVLATQSYHMPRALTICRTLGVDAVGISDDTAQQWSKFWWWGVARELGANWKMIWDLASHRPPKVGE